MHCTALKLGYGAHRVDKKFQRYPNQPCLEMNHIPIRKKKIESAALYMCCTLGSRLSCCLKLPDRYLPDFTTSNLHNMNI
jgi:hypothetical protein